MRFLCSRHCRYALALLLTFAAWVAGCWWVMPYRPRTIITEAGANRVDRRLVDISPNGDTIFFSCRGNRDGADAVWGEYWDTQTGKRIEEKQSEEWKEFVNDWEEPNPYRWNPPLARKFVEAMRFAIRAGSLGGHSYSEDGRFLALPAGERPNLDQPLMCWLYDYAVLDLSNGEQKALVHGCHRLDLISPQAQTGIERRFVFHEDTGELNECLVLRNFHANGAQTFIAETDGFDQIEPLFYSSDGEHVFARMHERSNRIHDSYAWKWWTIDGRQIATVHEKPRWHSDVRETAEALVDRGRVFVVIDSEDNGGTCRFWNVMTGEQIGEWRPSQGSSMLHLGRKMATSRDGRYIALFCAERQPVSVWDKWLLTKRIRSWLFSSNGRCSGWFVVILDATNLQELAQIPAGHSLISSDGRVLVTATDKNSISVYDLPLRKPWTCIFGFAAIGTLATCGGIMGLRRLFRRHNRLTPTASSQSASESPAPVPSAQP